MAGRQLEAGDKEAYLLRVIGAHSFGSVTPRNVLSLPHSVAAEVLAVRAVGHRDVRVVLLLDLRLWLGLLLRRDRHGGSLVRRLFWGRSPSSRGGSSSRGRSVRLHTTLLLSRRLDLFLLRCRGGLGHLVGMFSLRAALRVSQRVTSLELFHQEPTGIAMNWSNSMTGLFFSLQHDHDLRPSWNTGPPG